MRFKNKSSFLLFGCIIFFTAIYISFAEELKLPPLPSFQPGRTTEKQAEKPRKGAAETPRRYIVIPQDTASVAEIPGMVYVPAEEFIIGTDEGFKYEAPSRKIFIQGYYIDRSEVTNMQYQRFVETAGHNPPPHWKDGRYHKGEENFPVTNVNYYDALAYARWAGKRLPTEEEWEKAARGTDGRIYPWGNQWKKKAANVKPLIGFGGITASGSFPEGKSPYGCMDMAGNVWEWTTSWYNSYPGNVYEDPNFGEKYKVIRGGSYRQSEIIAQCPRRDFFDPELSRIDVGFRCAK